MQRIKTSSTGVVVAALALSCAGAAGLAFAAESAGGANSGVVASTWQHHTVSFPYFGRTSKYNCDALESTVRAILLHLGARRDLTVTAGGCGPANTPGRSAFVDTD